jgi:hypothetical protein
MIHRLLERRRVMTPSRTEPLLAYWESNNGVANVRYPPEPDVRFWLSHPVKSDFSDISSIVGTFGELGVLGSLVYPARQLCSPKRNFGWPPSEIGYRLP